MKTISKKNQCIYRLEKLRYDMRDSLEETLRSSEEPSIDELIFIYEVINDNIRMHELDRKITDLQSIINAENACIILKLIETDEKLKYSYVDIVESLSKTFLKKKTKVLKKVKE